MTISLPEYPRYEDVEWFAIDRVGFVARFTTGGEGPLPRSVLLQEDSHSALRELISKRALAGRADLLVHYTDSSDYLACAQRGVFAYDWTDVHRVHAAEIGVYELIARPTEPVTIESLGDRAKDMVRMLPRFELSFHESEEVAIADYIEWVRP